MSAPTVKFLGTTDDVTTCECCGKADLKNTVAISVDDGDAMYFGVVCAAHALSRDAKYVRSEARKADQEKARQEGAVRRAAQAAELAPWLAFLAKHGTGGDAFRRIESLGGYAAARQMFKQAQGA